MSYADRDGEIWMDGTFVPWREANVHVLTHTLHYGVGVFEGIRAYKTENGTAIFQLDRHIKRLFQSAHILRMAMPFDFETLKNACIECVRRNKLETAYLRPLVFYGSEGMGLHADNLSSHVAIAAWYWGAYLGDDALEQGIRVKTSSFSRHHINADMSKAKACGSYINSIVALTEASEDGYDEALLLDTNGLVMEGSGENIFIVRDNVIITPEPTSMLEGITRNSVIQLAGELGYEVVERSITRDEVYIADEAFFTGTAAELTPIREVDRRLIGCGVRGPVTTALQAKYLDVVNGRSPEHADWLTPV